MYIINKLINNNNIERRVKSYVILQKKEENSFWKYLNLRKNPL